MPTPYCTPQDLIDAFGEAELIETTDRAVPRAHEVDFAVAQQVCDRAAAEIDAAVAVQYTLPLASVPELLRYIAQDLARYYLWTDPAPPVVERYKAAAQQLRDLAARRLTLGADLAGVPVTAAASDLPAFAEVQGAFGRQGVRW